MGTRVDDLLVNGTANSNEEYAAIAHLYNSAGYSEMEEVFMIEILQDALGCQIDDG